MNREEQKQTIKDYLKRLGAGEELESVRVDFVKKFQSVDAAEIRMQSRNLSKRAHRSVKCRDCVMFILRCFMEKQEKSRSQMPQKQR